MASRRKLLHVFREVERLIRLPDNNFIYSGWDDTEDALAEIMPIYERVRQNQFPIHADILFLPTGPLQETSLSSGWGDEFCTVADIYDYAMECPEDCPCILDPLGMLEEETSLGMDQHFADVSLLRCSKCGQRWLRYQYENEGISRSGRWFLAAVDQPVTLELAKVRIESAVEYWCGGSYYDGKVSLAYGPIHL